MVPPAKRNPLFLLRIAFQKYYKRTSILWRINFQVIQEDVGKKLREALVHIHRDLRNGTLANH